ncbi:hypothetical protein ADL15_31995 [Actinoplanes awajinensis subsp. mycoplanecinus]|uniref:Uncharacterized protein n=1 Tax=Actinoplanes awajinensis subsp. mycoplanecinus TaxID=135947 RepID=A0A101JKB1_9ACTN|nr:hypothetical protein ADL15_31995 [Actinoplanes awajinensis subsp. mycoplanecinus]
MPPVPPVSEWARPPEGPAQPAYPFPQPPPPAAYPPPGYHAAPAWPQPGTAPAAPAWPPPGAPPAAPAGVRTGVILAVIMAIAVVAVGGLYATSRGQDDPPPIANLPFSLPSGFPTFPSLPALPTETPGVPGVSEPSVDEGPQASTFPAGDIDDLDRVCDENVYYPASPKRTGKAPHPVVVLKKDSPDDVRFQDRVYYFRDEGTTKAQERIWGSDDPAKVQLVACTDRAAVGTKIRNCKYDDPEPDTLALYRATWRLRIYEVATHRLLLDKKLPGDEQTCPSSVLVGPDKKIYATAGDRAVLAQLRKFVTK